MFSYDISWFCFDIRWVFAYFLQTLQVPELKIDFLLKTALATCTYTYTHTQTSGNFVIETTS